MKFLLCIIAVGAVLHPVRTFAASSEDYSNLKKEVEDLRKKLNGGAAPKAVGPIGRADATVANRYGPNAPVTTKKGKLTVGGLLQVWTYHIDNDNLGAFSLLHTKYNDQMTAAFPNSQGRIGGWNGNELNDNDGYRIRRAEIKLSLEVNDDITAVIMVDPTGGDESNTFPAFPTNQGVVGRTPFGTGADFDLNGLQNAGYLVLWSPVPPGNVNSEQRSRMRSGFMAPNRVLQDAYINYHPAWIPRHDFTIGQFKPPMSEEGNRNSGQLDFVERAMINQFSNQRDLGVMVHGSWWNDRFQYWVGAFNSAGNFHNTFASFQNRTDDNDEKDIAWRMLVRPVWNKKNWGSLELGYSRQDGIHGESGNGARYGSADFFLGITSADFTVDGLSFKHDDGHRQYAWAWYRPGGPVRGWWMRGEWAEIEDRPTPGVWNVNAPVLQPDAFKRTGWYFSTGYKLSDSVWADSLKNHPNWLIKMAHDVEFCYRYEVFDNIFSDGLTDLRGQVPFGGGFFYLIPKDIDTFKTQVHTAGINYYWRGYNTRTQINYSWVDEPQGHRAFSPLTSSAFPGFQTTGRRFREVKNNVFIISQQIMW